MHGNHHEWDMEIVPRSALFDLRLAELWRYRDLLWLLVRRDFVSFYKQTILGPLWFFIQPLFTTLIYVMIFGRLAGISTDGLPQPLFYMTGIVIWNYFSECIVKTSTVFRDNAAMFGKVYFPRLIMPVSIVFSNLIRFGVQFLMLLLMVAYYVVFKDYDFQPTGYLLLLPALVILMGLLGLGSGMIISALTSKYRDLSFLLAFGVQLLMYASPVIYPLSAAPSKFANILNLNPLTSILETTRLALLGKGQWNTTFFVYTVAFTLLTLLIGIVTFNRVEKNFVDTV